LFLVKAIHARGAFAKSVKARADDKAPLFHRNPPSVARLQADLGLGACGFAVTRPVGKRDFCHFL
jgi:hypothetical protein